MAAAVVMPELTVVVGAPAMASALPAGQGVVVEAEIGRARALKRELLELGAADRVLVASEVLTANHGQAVLWHRFNDGRFDGPWPLEHWQGQYPNVLAQHCEERNGRCLAAVLNVWQQKVSVELGDWQKLSITLVLRQGDALAAMAGCGAWFRAVQAVRLDHPLSGLSAQEPLATWLSQRGFSAAEGGGSHWQRDPIATLNLELEESREKIIRMEEQLSFHAVRLLLAQTKSQKLMVERDSFQLEKEGLVAERRELAAQVLVLTQQRDDVVLPLEQLSAE
jgi:hypothetical protein